MTTSSTNRPEIRGAEPMTTLRTFRTLRIALPVVLLSLAAWLAAPALATNPPDPGYDAYGAGGSGDAGEALDPDTGYEGSYSYVRRLEGSATLIQGASGERQAIEGQQPVLAGDRIWVAPSGRVEVVLSDRNLLRIDGGSEVAFDTLAASPDRQDSSTTLRLTQGNVQLVVVDDFLGEDLPRIDTGNATVYPRGPGSLRITSGGEDWTEAVARDGAADVVTRDGSISIEQGEEAVIDGRYPTRSNVRQASGEDSLELWGRRLDQEARYAETPYVDDSLGYQAASLDRYGSWVQAEGAYGWRPRVASDWRPYWDGRWDFSPLGLTWVSYEPWGWVPYHYGSWDYVNDYGWVWFPGQRFRPAWVYWYWTDDYAGWIPVGYYAHFYHHYLGPSFGFRFGVYGWAGGGWGAYGDWLFCNRGYLGYRYQNRYAQPGDRFGRQARYAVPRRGLVTTDTRGITRAELRKGDSVVNVLAAKRRDAGRELPDVTSFVARKPELPQDVRRRIAIDRSAGDRRPRSALIAVDRADASTSKDRPGTLVERPAVRAPVARRPSADATVRTPPRLDGRVPRVPTSRDESWRNDGARRRLPEVRIERPAPAAPVRTPSRALRQDDIRPQVVPERPTTARSARDSARPPTSGDRPPAAGTASGQGWRDRRPVADRQAFPPAGADRTDRGRQRTYELPVGAPAGDRRGAGERVLAGAHRVVPQAAGRGGAAAVQPHPRRDRSRRSGPELRHALAELRHAVAKLWQPPSQRAVEGLGASRAAPAVPAAGEGAELLVPPLVGRLGDALAEVLGRPRARILRPLHARSRAGPRPSARQLTGRAEPGEREAHRE